MGLVNLEIPINYGYGDFMYSPPGFHQCTNLRYIENGSWVCRHTFKEMANPGTELPITDLYIVPGQNHTYLISNGKFYYTSQITEECTYTECSGPALTFTPVRGTWCEVGSNVIYCEDGQGRPVYFPLSSPSSYNLLASDVFTSNFDGACASSNNCILISGLGGARIHYSAVNSILFDGSYVVVGPEQDPIMSMINLGSSLIVLKKNSIFARSTENAKFISTQFGEIINNIPSVSGKQRLCPANGVIYFATQSGFYNWAGSNLTPLTTGFGDQWLTYGENCVVLYNAMLNQIWLIYFENYYWLTYDLKSGVWSMWSSPYNNRSAESDSRGNIFIGHGNGKITCWYNNQWVGTGGEQDIPQTTFTAWNDCGDLIADKALKRIYVYGSGIDEIKVFGRTAPDQTPTTGKLIKHIIEPSGTCFSCDDTKTFKEISIYLKGSGNMILRKIELDVEIRNKTNAR